MPFVTVGEENSGPTQIYYEDHGSGKPIVLIHGWPLSSASWEKQVPALLQAGHRVIAYDRRGFGHSSKTVLDYDYDTFARDLHELIMKLDLRNLTLAGFSMGGGEVARYLGTYGSERVERAVFLSAIPPFMLKTEDNPEGLDGSILHEAKQAIVADRPAMLAKFFTDFYNVDVLRGKLISEEALRLSWNIAAMASPMGTLECFRVLYETDFRGDLKRIDIPTLVVHGDADRICPFNVTGKRTNEMVNGSRLVVIDGAPHGTNWTHAEQLNGALIDFLAQDIRDLAA